MYRIHVYDKTTTGMHWHIHKDGARHYDKYKALKQRMPAAFAVGRDPAVIYSATAPLPEAVDEMMFAGYLRREPVEMVKCITSDILVPANSELVIEGYLEPGGSAHRRCRSAIITDSIRLPTITPVFHVHLYHAPEGFDLSRYCCRQATDGRLLYGEGDERIFLPLMKLDKPEI